MSRDVGGDVAPELILSPKVMMGGGVVSLKWPTLSAVCAFYFSCVKFDYLLLF